MTACAPRRTGARWSRRDGRTDRGGTTRRRPARPPRRARTTSSGSLQHEVQVDRACRTSRRCAAPPRPACMPSTSQPPGASGRASAAIASGSSEAARWISEYQPSTADQPVAGGRPHQPAQVADLVGAVREPAARLLDHPRRQVDAGGVRAGVGEVRRDVARPAADLDDRSAVGVRDHPVEQPALEGQPGQLVERGARRTPPPRRRTTPAPARRGPRRRRRARCRGRRRAPRRRPRTRAGSPSRCTQRLSCSPPRRGSSRTSPRSAIRAQGLLDGAAGRRRRAAARCGCCSSPGACGAAQQQHREQRPLVVGQARACSSSVWWYFSVRRPVSDQTIRSSPRSLSRRPTCSTVCSSYVGDRVAAAALVAGGAQGVEGQRVRRRHGRLLLQQAAEDALLLGVELGEVGHKTRLGAGHRSHAPA